MILNHFASSGGKQNKTKKRGPGSYGMLVSMRGSLFPVSFVSLTCLLPHNLGHVLSLFFFVYVGGGRVAAIAQESGHAGSGWIAPAGCVERNFK